MTARKQAKNFHHHPHLLIQFIWSELILASEHTTQAMNILVALSKTPKKNLHAPLLVTLSNHVMKLSGSADDYMRLFSWGEYGILAKLKNYCSLFTQDKIGTGKDQINMSNKANRAWLLSLEALDQIRAYQHNGIALDIEALTEVMIKIKRSIAHLKRLTSVIALEFRSDENVLLFLLRHQELLDTLHQRGFVKKLLNKMFPKGKKAVAQLLIKKYTARGFNHFVPFIRAKIKKL